MTNVDNGVILVRGEGDLRAALVAAEEVFADAQADPAAASRGYFDREMLAHDMDAQVSDEAVKLAEIWDRAEEAATVACPGAELVLLSTYQALKDRGDLD